MTIHILVTNDDGVYSNGLRMLAREMKKIGKVSVVAPVSEKSATSHSLTLHRPLRATRIGRNDTYAVNGTPTDCVNLALNGLLTERPQIVVSGINVGANLADDVTYSGTVAAAMEATLQGLPAIAVSIAGRTRLCYSPAQDIAARLVRRIIRDKLPQNILLNVNIPNRPAQRIQGYRFTRLGKRQYGDSIVEKVDPRGEKYYWIGGDILGEKPVENSDIEAVSQGYISITPLHLDLTAYSFLRKMSAWKV